MRSYKAKIRGLNKAQFQRLRELSQHAKNLYNQTLWILRQGFELTGKHYPYQQMDKVMKQVSNLEGRINYKLLKAKVAQQTLRKLDTNFKSFFKAFKDYKQQPKKYKGCPRPPKYKRNAQDNLIYDYQAFQRKHKLIQINQPMLNKTGQYPVMCMLQYQQTAMLEKGLEIKIPLSLWDKQIKQIEIIPRHHSFDAVFAYQEDSVDLHQVVPNDNCMSIDLGMNNLATCVTNGLIPPFIIDGKRLKHINFKYHKDKARFQSKLATRARKWSRRLQRLTDKRNRAVNDYLHKASAIIVNHCKRHDISTVYVGDLAKSLNTINLGKRTNQNFMMLALGQFVEMLNYKLGEHNVNLCIIDESYTSKASFIDGDTIPKKYNNNETHSFSGRRVKRGLYKSKHNTLINADVNGAFNILKKSAHNNCNFSDLVNKLGNKITCWLHPKNKFMPLPTKAQCFWINLRHRSQQVT